LVSFTLTEIALLAGYSTCETWEKQAKKAAIRKLFKRENGAPKIFKKVQNGNKAVTRKLHNSLVEATDFLLPYLKGI
jgi:sugar diacid utilization regulator